MFRVLTGGAVEFILYVANFIISYLPSHSFRKYFYRHAMKFKIGENSFIFMGATFDTRNNFTLGDNSVINQNCRLDNRGGLYIGNNVSISSEVQILTADHDPHSPQFEGSNNWGQSKLKLLLYCLCLSISISGKINSKIVPRVSNRNASACDSTWQ